MITDTLVNLAIGYAFCCLVFLFYFILDSSLRGKRYHFEVMSVAALLIFSCFIASLVILLLAVFR